jgi:cytochrome P450
MEDNMREKISLWVGKIGNHCVKDVRTDLRYIAIDVISRHLWGEAGEFKTLSVPADAQLLQDILEPTNIYLPSWLIHFPRLTTWAEKSMRAFGVNPMQTIRDHAYECFQKFKAAGVNSEKTTTVGGKLWSQHVSNGGPLTDDDVAAELGDLFLAGLDTTADTLSYIFWLLSKPEYANVQEKLRREVATLKFENDMPAVADTDKLPYLDAVIKETLRIYPINAGSQPRVAPSGKPVVIYELHIPPGTICEMQALSLNRDPEVYEYPDEFNPERWMIPRDSPKFKEMNRQLWSFSSGQRMCIGLQYISSRSG